MEVFLIPSSPCTPKDFAEEGNPHSLAGGCRRELRVLPTLWPQLQRRGGTPMTPFPVIQSWMPPNWKFNKTSSSGPNHCLQQSWERSLMEVRLTSPTVPFRFLYLPPRPPSSWVSSALFLGLDIVISRTDLEHDIIVNDPQSTLLGNCSIHSILPPTRRPVVNWGSHVTMTYPPSNGMESAGHSGTVLPPLSSVSATLVSDVVSLGGKGLKR